MSCLTLISFSQQCPVISSTVNASTPCPLHQRQDKQALKTWKQENPDESQKLPRRMPRPDEACDGPRVGLVTPSGQFLRQY